MENQHEFEEIFSIHSNPVVEFKSTWNFEKSPANLVSRGINATASIKTANQSTETSVKKEIGTQTEAPAAVPNRAPVNETHLAEWLTRISPLMEAELRKGCTNVFQFNKDSSSVDANGLQMFAYQKIQLDGGAAAGDENLMSHGCAAWLSVVTNDAPLLCVTASPRHSSWCDHEPPPVRLFIPSRNRDTGTINYVEQQTLPSVKTCIQVLVTNPYNKDMLAGGTYSGDLHVWQYDATRRQMSEIPCETSPHGTVVAIIWLRPSSGGGSDRFTVLSAHEGGYLVLWTGAKQIQKDKIFQIKPRSKGSDLAPQLTALATISNYEFVVGTDDGRIFLGSIKQTVLVAANVYDPIVLELEPHRYAVQSLLVVVCEQSKLVSSDMSGEVFVRNLDTELTEPSGVVKMPLPISRQIVVTNDLAYILTPSGSGDVDLIRLSSTTVQRIRCEFTTADSSQHSSGNVLQLSSNNCFAVAGTFRGQFQIFRLERTT